MRRLLLVLVVLAMVMGVMAAPVGANGPEPGKATGHGQLQFLTSDVFWNASFTAQGTPDNAKGKLLLNNTFLDKPWHGTVDCYYQDGNEAWFTGPAFGPNIHGDYWGAYVADNGEPGTASPPDQFVVLLNDSPDFFDCGDSFTQLLLKSSASFYGDSLRGNIQVH